MSWSFSAIGRPVAIAASAKEQLNRYRCSEPEETIKNSVVDIISTALASYDAKTAVHIEASGSQWTDSTTGTAANSLNLSIKPIPGFVE